MRFIILFFLIILLNNCTTVEVTKEIIKAGNSVKTSVSGIVKENEPNTEEEKQAIDSVTINDEKEFITSEQKQQSTIVQNQQKTSQINFLGKSLNKIEMLLGEAQLAREDGNIYMLRYDSEKCRLFIFFNNNSKKSVKYFEIRNNLGDLISAKNSIQECYMEFKLI